jgi:hypothetical protein
MKLSLFVGLVPLLVACTCAPARAPDAGGGSSCAQACANWARVGCAEGASANCNAACVSGGEIETVPTACLAKAVTPGDVAACGEPCTVDGGLGYR